MSSENKSITAADFPLALFMLGMPLILAAYSLSNTIAPSNLADILITGLAVIGFLAEPFRNEKDPVAPTWFKVGIPGLLITWISLNSFAGFVFPLVDFLPFLMEARPLIYLLVLVLWITLFGMPDSKQISFWSSCLAILVSLEFGLNFFLHGLAVEPNIFGHYTLTGPILLAGLCATLHSKHENRFTRLVIICGIFCTLTRDISLAAVTIMLLFGPRGILRKMLLVFTLLFFTYISLIPQDMTMLNRNDLPQYWIWFSCLELLARTPSLLLSGFPISIPLPLTVPASLWNIWYDQQYIWTDQGVLLFHITPFWLHMLIGWGLGGIVIIFTGLTFLYRKFPSDMLAGLITTIVMTGLFSPLFYSPPSAIALLYAFICSTRPEIQRFKFE